MKKSNIKVEGQSNGTDTVVVSIDDSSVDNLADKVAERLLPLLFVCARVASRDTIRTPMRDLRAIFKDVVEEAKIAHGFYADSLN